MSDWSWVEVSVVALIVWAIISLLSKTGNTWPISLFGRSAGVASIDEVEHDLKRHLDDLDSRVSGLEGEGEDD